MSMAEKPVQVKELRALPDQDLQSQLEKVRKELWQTKSKSKEGSLQQTHVFGGLRRQIARIETLLRERKAAG